MEELFSKVLQVNVRCKDNDERKTNTRVTIELQKTSQVHKRDLLVKLTDDKDPFFLFKLSISEEDFQSLKVQQGLLVDFASFPQKFIDLLNLCNSEEESETPRDHLSAGDVWTSLCLVEAALGSELLLSSRSWII